MRGHLTKKKKPNSDEYYRNWYVVIDMVDEFGRRKRKWVATKTDKKKDAEKALAKIVNEANEGKLVIEKELKLGEFLTKWRELHAKPNMKESTLKKVDWAISKLTSDLKNTSITKLTPVQIQKFVNSECEKMSSTTVKIVYDVLNQSLNKAIRWGYLAKNPCQFIDPPKISKPKKTVLTPHELRSLLEASKGTSSYLPLLIIASTGIRRGELCALQWQDVDFEKGLLRISRSLDIINGDVIINSPKTTSGTRSIKLPTNF